MIEGKGFLGSSASAVSTANQEIVVNNLNWTNFSLYKLNFYNTEAVSVKINKSTPIYLMAGQGFSSDSNDGDVKISSFIIVDVGIHYNFIGAY